MTLLISCLAIIQGGTPFFSSFAALLVIHRQCVTCVSGAALALVVVGELDAAVRAVRVARVGEALVDITLTTLAHVAGGADAVVATDAVHALAMVEALGFVGDGVGGGVAVVDVDFAVHA